MAPKRKTRQDAGFSFSGLKESAEYGSNNNADNDQNNCPE